MPNSENLIFSPNAGSLLPEIPRDELAKQSEWPDKEIEKANAEIVKAARAIRLHFYRLIPILRRFPYYALEADGRGGWLDSYNLAYTSCIFGVHKENESWGSHDLFLELRTGSLIGAKTSSSNYVIAGMSTFEFGGDTTMHVASDTEIFSKLAGQDPRYRFDPIWYTEHLIEQSKKPYHNSPEEVERSIERKELARQHLDQMMASIPLEEVLTKLRELGFEV